MGDPDRTVRNTAILGQSYHSKTIALCCGLDRPSSCCWFFHFLGNRIHLGASGQNEPVISDTQLRFSNSCDACPRIFALSRRLRIGHRASPSVESGLPLAATKRASYSVLDFQYPLRLTWSFIYISRHQRTDGAKAINAPYRHAHRPSIRQQFQHHGINCGKADSGQLSNSPQVLRKVRTDHALTA